MNSNIVLYFLVVFLKPCSPGLGRQKMQSDASIKAIIEH